MEVPGPSPDAQTYAGRRQRIADRLGDDVMVLYGGDQITRSADTEYPFRPDSDFHYLTGLAEPGAVLVLRNKAPQSTLFVRPRDRPAEIWSGIRLGPEGALERYGVDEAHPLAELNDRLPELLLGSGTVHTQIGRYPEFTNRLHAADRHNRRRERYGAEPVHCWRDVQETVGEDRVVKDEAGLASLRKAVDLSAAGHVAAMAQTRPGMFEYEVEALLHYTYRCAGSTGAGYGSIVGGGARATILHYVDNREQLRDGELLLIDSGAEWDYFTGDITRTFPVSGTFTPAQRDLYEVVLKANEAGVDATRAGGDIEKIHALCLRILCEGLKALGLCRAESVDAIIESKDYERYYMHRTSHWLGVDVHDTSRYCHDQTPRPFAPGHVITVEPGLYIAPDDDRAPAELLGTGVRIEDDVLVTDAAPDVLSSGAPKSIAAIEEACRRD